MVYFQTWFMWICHTLLFLNTIKAIKVIGQDVTVTAGENAQIFCQVMETAETLTSIRWQRRTKKKPTNTDILIITSDGKQDYIDGLRDQVNFTANFTQMNGSILLNNVTVLDEGIYTCIFSVFPSGPYKTEVHLTVQVPPLVTVRADVPVSGKTDVILATCTAANAKPAAEVSWSLGSLTNSVNFQNNVTMDPEKGSTVESSLVGIASTYINQKKVQCVVTHPGLKEKLELSYTLNVHYPPQVAYINSVDVQGQTWEFQCEADANPKPTNFTWSRYFPVNETLSSGVNNRLIIQLTPNSNNLFHCVASNQYGNAVGSLFVPIALSTESKTCWTLYIITIVVGVCCFPIWKFNVPQRLRNWCNRSDPVPTDSPTQEQL